MELKDLLGHWVIPILVMGSLVDICQFAHVIVRGYRSWKQSVYRKIKAEVLLDEMEHKKKWAHPVTGRVCNEKEEG